eukprot:TRINITY_DN53277_c0_g3_i1.p1 TRINITY_DN53277_c0_g3~~TRINITY_DN53277_c0_g3_i1.p1  ORF type:complete len:789 (+),score=28.01 TRINITY_DN53277_c0_g3_i1:656-3022(+)
MVLGIQTVETGLRVAVLLWKIMKESLKCQGLKLSRVLCVNKEFDQQGLEVVSIKESELESVDIESFEYLLVSGGDGAIRRVVEFMAKKSINMPKLIVDPEGTFNMIYKLYRIKDPKTILEKIANNESIEEIERNYFSVNSDHYFIFSAGNSLDMIYIILSDLFRVGFLVKSKLRYLFSIIFLLPLMVMMIPFFLVVKKYFLIFNGYDFKLKNILNIHLNPDEVRLELDSDYNIWQMDGDVVVVRSKSNHIKKAGRLKLIIGQGMLKPVLKDRVAYFVLDEEHYDSARAKKDALDLKKLATTLKGLDIKAILLSLKNVPDLDNESLIHFFRILHEFEKSLDVIAGVCDYKARVYTQSLESAKKYHISLFQNSEVARFILKVKKLPEDKQLCFLMENELDFELFKDEMESRGVLFQGFSSSNEFSTYVSKNECFKVSKTYVDYLHNKTVMRLEGGVVYFDLQDRLGKKIETLFPLHAFFKKAKEGFRLFVLEGSQVEFIDPKAIDFFITLSINSIKYGAKIVFFKFPANLLNRSVEQTLQKAHIKCFDTKLKMQADAEIAQLLKAPVKTKGGGLSKALVSNLPLFIDATVETFSSFVGSSATKKSHSISEYSDSFLKGEYAGSAIEFSGMINGSLILVFSYDLINEVSQVLLGEACGSDEERVDVLSEFLNIISGQSKTMLSKKDINVSISLPKTFVSRDEFLKYVGSKKGILMNFEFDAKPLQLFLAPQCQIHSSRYFFLYLLGILLKGQGFLKRVIPRYLQILSSTSLFQLQFLATSTFWSLTHLFLM